MAGADRVGSSVEDLKHIGIAGCRQIVRDGNRRLDGRARRGRDDPRETGDLRFARSEAARMSDSVYLSVSGKGANACYILYTGVRNDCDCAGGQAVCKSTDSAIIKTEWLPTSQPMRLRSNAETPEFQHRQALVTQTGSIEVSIDNDTGIRQVMTITGRVRNCYTTTKPTGMPKCG